MDNWKTSVEARVGYTAQQKQHNLLSDLTMEGISITGGLSCIEIIVLQTLTFYSVIICRIGSDNFEPTWSNLFSQ